MNKKLILILLFFFALFTPLVFNSPSKIYEVFAGGPIAPTPFGPGPVVPPGGVSGGTGTTIPVQTPVAGKAFNGWNGTSFDTVTMPTPAPTPTAVPASTPVAGQAVTGFGAGVSSVTRESFQAPLPTATPTPGEAMASWDGNTFTTIPVVDQATYNALVANIGSGPLGTISTHADTDFLASTTFTQSTSDPTNPCTVPDAIWQKVDTNGIPYPPNGDILRCTCDGADGATNCSWKSIYPPIDSSAAGFVAAATLTCGAGTEGKFAVESTTLCFCDNSATPTKRCVALGNSTGEASALDILASTEDATPTLANYFVMARDKNSPFNIRKIELDKVGGVPTASVTTCRDMRLDTVNTQNNYAFMDTLHGTNLDYSFVRFIDAQTAIAYYGLYIPPDLAAAPAWYIVVESKSGGTGTGLYLSIDCEVIGDNVAFDGSLTSILAGSGGVTTIRTGANLSINSINCGSNCDATLALVAGSELYCKITRTGGDSADTVNADWYLRRIEVCYAHNVN